ncbi:MAG: phytoene desaturase family protein [Candidatus Dadabacteria bacterium]
MSKQVHVIGSGFAGLAAATVLGKEGYQVTVLEKNEQAGGRARVLKENGYVFDMGPSWYWMPDIFEKYFSLFDRKPSDYYELIKLNPAFTIFFAGGERMDVPTSMQDLFTLFEQKEKGAAEKLKSFLDEAGVKYRLAVDELIYLPSLSLREFLKPAILKNIPKLSLFTRFDKHVRKYFKHPQLIQLMEFPVLFLGASSARTPSLYSLMNYASLTLSTWYPVGGFSKITGAMSKLAGELGVKIQTGEAVEGIQVKDGRINSLRTSKSSYSSQGIIGASDYAHTDQLLPPVNRNYSQRYWEKRTFSPSALIFYLGVNKKLVGLNHHNLFFDKDLDRHSHEIYNDPQWPSEPLFYVCCPSKTDDSVAPEGHENLFILVPLAAGLEDTNAVREKYFDMVMKRMEAITGESISTSIDYKKSYCINEFKSDYNAYKGNAYGLANTYLQTAFLRPSMRNKTVKNLVYAGQLTVPGPGVPPALISGQIAAEQMIKILK